MRVDAERYAPALIQIAPPYPDAVQDVNVSEERVSEWPDEREADIAPPFPFDDEH